MVFSYMIQGRPGGLFQFTGGEPSGSFSLLGSEKIFHHLTVLIYATAVQLCEKKSGYLFF